MEYFSKDISRLVSELSRLPGVGQKSPQLPALHIIHAPKEEATELAEASGKCEKQRTLLQVLLYDHRSGDLSDLCIRGA